MQRIILSVLLVMIGMVWAMPVAGQDAEKTIYNDPDLAYQEALRRIEAARISRATELNLGDSNLYKLPPEIGQLADLDRHWSYRRSDAPLPLAAAARPDREKEAGMMLFRRD